MLDRSTPWALGLGLSLAAAASMAACGGSTLTASTSTATGGGHPGTGGMSTGTGAMGGGGSDTFVTSTGTGTTQPFDVQPTPLQTITVTAGQTTPTVDYTATLNGNPIAAGWTLDRGDLGTIPPGPSPTATFAPSGTAGGLVTIQAGLNGMTLKRQVMIQLTAQQNGPNPSIPSEAAQIATTVPDLTAGGGIGGVGGEGLGIAVSDPALVATLGAPASDGSAQALKFLYPYDKTVWPRGIPAPLLMWDWTIGDADAIQIQIKTTTGSFSYTGTFARPPILAQTGGKFIRHPIPQDIWDMATTSAGGTDQLTISLTVAQGGQAYGPISQTWTIAPARLSGTIYYQSYGTNLAKNLGGAVGGDGLFGGAVLSIRVGDTGPKLVAGSNTACRVCHSVAAFGSSLVATDYGPYYAYDLTPTGAVEHQLPNSGAWFPGIYPDGSMMLTGDGELISLPNGGAPIATTGLAGQPYMPAFSPDGKLVAFNPGIGSQLSVMSFDLATFTFSGQTTIVDDTGQGLIPGWPAFFPDGKSVVFEQESAPSALDGDSSGILWTREGAKGQIAWTTTAGAGSVTPLDQLNGKGYLPKLATGKPMSCYGDSGFQEGGIDADHGDDVNLNYEPTVNPIASGGYAWVVFTSRRMYGSVADIPPFCSDPRGVDLVQNITPKKLWVAAIDLTGQPGADASHPAFYLPAQEILAGNSRGFWVLDPCKPDGDTCSTGDQCCGGYCEPNGPGGALVCSDTPPMSMCSQPQEKCTTAADCCDPTNLCVGGFCALKGPA